MSTPDNILYYGDNLDILRNHTYYPNECVDLIYLDPPFNSARSYNVLFKDESGRASEAQITAFEDTWHWGPQAEHTYRDLVAGDYGTPRVSKAIGALRDLLGDNQMMAYLVMMAARLVELHRVLKPTGSLYLHCDPTASHYLKIVLDAIFDPRNFRNEIIWKRTSAHANVGKKFGAVHDTIFFYSKTDRYTWNAQHTPYEQEYIDTFFDQIDEQGRRYARRDLTASMQRASKGQLYEWKGIRPPASRCWAFTKENMDEFDALGRIHYPKKEGGMPRLKLYPENLPGNPLQDVWDDIRPLHNLASERLDYPTQKPVSLLERIISVSSKPGDTILDPFCGCGTAIAAAQKLGRRWLGIDITHLSIALQKYRLQDMFQLKPGDYRIIGEPEDLHSAQALAKDSENDGRYQFQWWALSLVRAKPLGQTVSGGREGKKGSDKGVDGVISFIDDASGKPKEVLVQVKSGKVGSALIREFRGTMERRKSAIGVFITLEPPTRDMEAEAAAAGYYESEHFGKFPRVQILSIEQLLKKADVNMPRYQVTFKQAARVKEDSKTTVLMFET